MDSDRTFPAGSRRARVALLVAGAVLLAAAAVGVRAALGGHDHPPAVVAEAGGAGTTVAGQDTGVTVAVGGSGGQPAPGGSTGGGGGAGGGSSGAGTVRYQWGRGAGDHRSEVRTYTIDKAAERRVTSHGVDDTVSGSSDSPTDTIVDYIHILEPNGPNGPFNFKMISKVCP